MNEWEWLLKLLRAFSVWGWIKPWGHWSVSDFSSVEVKAAPSFVIFQTQLMSFSPSLGQHVHSNELNWNLQRVVVSAISLHYQDMGPHLSVCVLSTTVGLWWHCLLSKLPTKIVFENNCKADLKKIKVAFMNDGEIIWRCEWMIMYDFLFFIYIFVQREIACGSGTLYLVSVQCSHWSSLVTQRYLYLFSEVNVKFQILFWLRLCHVISLFFTHPCLLSFCSNFVQHNHVHFINCHW